MAADDDDPDDSRTAVPLDAAEAPDSVTALPPQLAPWQRMRGILRHKLGEDNFQRLFSGTSAEIRDGNRVLIFVPNLIHQLWIEQNFAAALADAAAEVLQVPSVIEYVAVDEPEAKDRAPNWERPELKAARGPAPRAYVNGTHGPVGLTEETTIRSFGDAGLNAKFNFDSFVVGSNSSYSAAVARTVAEKPGRIYNPLFFYGATGLGKTHLMQAIGQEVLTRKKRSIVRYVTSEQFTNEYVDAIKRGNFPQFRQKYRKVDVLLIDDVQFFEGKDSTQEEFFHTFNELFNNQRQIVLASDRAPGEIKNLEARLVSRFEWGLTTQIQIPDFETRVAILRRKASDFNVAIEPWILEFMAQRIRNNVRKLEGALMRIAAHVSLDRAVTDETALGKLLSDLIDEEPAKSVTVDRVQRAVATHYDLRVADLTGPRRPKNIAEARQVAMYLTRHLIGLPLMQIGEEFGGRDHGTVIHACKVITGRMKATDDFRLVIEKLTAKVLES